MKFLHQFLPEDVAIGVVLGLAAAIYLVHRYVKRR